MRPSTSITILLAAAIVSAGIYFGLRSAAEVPPAVGPSQAPVLQPPTPQPQRAPTDAETRSRVDALVAEALPKWKAACWEALDPPARKPGRYAAMLSFAADGRLVMFGIQEVRGESDFGIAACLRKQDHAFSLPAPGRPLTFEVPFQIP